MAASAHYRITHQTRYRYSEPVAICQNQLRMMPRTLETRYSGVQCERVATSIEPEPDTYLEHVDYFGNRVISFSIESLHEKLEVTVQSDVAVHHDESVLQNASAPWEEVSRRIFDAEDPLWLETQEYVYDSPRVRRGVDFADYARLSFQPGRSIFDAALDLTRRIHDEFEYDTTATDVNTSPEEAFNVRAGVCQDFAHVQIACLRSIGLPARYVSGYLRTVPPEGKRRMVGADESHAWISLYAGETIGWIDFDPTNALVSDTNHVPVCIGRDYSEVSPMRGVVLGGGNPQLKVSVDVAPRE